MKRLALTDIDFKSDLLGCNATDLSQEVYNRMANDKDTMENILFGDGESFMAFVKSNFLQQYSDEYTTNNPDYDAGALNTELDNMGKAIYNNICNKLEVMNVKDMLQYIGIQLARK